MNLKNESVITSACAEDMIRYREGIETLIKLGSTKAVSNGLPQHAAILFELFFKHSKEQVRIFCKNLNSVVFNSPALVEAAGFALQNGRKVRVMVQEEPEPSAFLTMFGREKVIIAPPLLAEWKANFAIMDENAMRYEPDRKDVTATAWFNNPELVKGFSQFFDNAALIAERNQTVA